MSSKAPFLLLLAALATSTPIWAADHTDAAIPAVEQSFQDPMTPLLEVVSQDDLWQRIRNGFALREMDNPLIARHEQWYASRPDYVARMTERAGRYLHFIVEEVEKRGMPTEIALLPMIESAFNPSAYSIASASGIWQFIPSTGKNFGMQQNWWYDGRRDIVTATRGALDYLQKLHGQFGDWELAMAAYNWGEGAVQRAQERNRAKGLPTDYASLTLPDETRNYLPKLMAVKNIVSSPWNYGLTLQSIPDQPYFTAVTLPEHIDVKVAAKLADISTEEFIALNPAHTRPVILQNNTDTLLLPVGKVDVFYSNLEQYNLPLVNWQRYQSRKGERLDKLAPRFGLTLEKLKSINGLSARAKISSGQVLLVPLASSQATQDFEAFNMHLSARGNEDKPAVVSKGKSQTKAGKSHTKLARQSPHRKSAKTTPKQMARKTPPTGKAVKLANANRQPTKQVGKQPARRVNVASHP